MTGNIMTEWLMQFDSKTTTIYQPLDQDVIKNFKVVYRTAII